MIRITDLDGAAGVQVKAAVMVCDAWLTFENASTVRQWVTGMLQVKWPDVDLLSQAPTEVIVGWRVARDDIQTLNEILHLVMARAGLGGEGHRVAVFDVEIEKPTMQVWCVAAVPEGQLVKPAKDGTSC